MNAVKNAKPAVVIDPSDAILKARVEAALKLDRDRRLKDLKVGVNHGVIQMDATGVTLTGRLRAIQLAWDAAENADPGDSGPSPAAAANSTNGITGEKP